MYSTDISRAAHKQPIKEGYCWLNKNQAAGHILAHYSKQHAIGIEIVTIEALLKVDNRFKTGDICVAT